MSDRELLRKAAKIVRDACAHTHWNENGRAVAEQIEALATLVSPGRCPCGDRERSQCPGAWEQRCDLGNNPAYVERSTVTGAEVDAALATPSADRWVLVPRNLVQACIDHLPYKSAIIPELTAALAAAPAAPAAEPSDTDRIEALERWLEASGRVWLHRNSLDFDCRQTVRQQIDANLLTGAAPAAEPVYSECAANGSGPCRIAPDGPRGELQCVYCGEPPSAAAPGATPAQSREPLTLTDEQIDAAVYAVCPDFDQWHEGPSLDDIRAIVRAVGIGSREPLTADPDKPHAVNVPGYGWVDVRAVRAIERAHRIGSQP